MTDMKLTVRLKTGRDDALIAAIQSIPPGQREALFRRGLAWYLVPGGFRELADRFESGTGPAAGTGRAPTILDLGTAAQRALAQLGFDED